MFSAHVKWAQPQTYTTSMCLAIKLSMEVRWKFSQLWVGRRACYVGLMVRGSPNPRYFGLPTRLRRARKYAGLTRTALAQRVGGDQTTALDIETNRRLPTVGTVARLATGLGVSAAWLGFGLGDMVTEEPPATCNGMGERLQSVRQGQGYSKAALARSVSLSPTALANIEKGAQSGVEVIAALAKVLRVSPAWLAFHQGPQVLPSRRHLQVTKEHSSPPTDRV